MAGEHNYVGSPTSVRQAAYYPSMSVAPTAAAYGVGPAVIEGQYYWSDGSDWFRKTPSKYDEYDLLSDAPTAAEYGVGSLRIGGRDVWSDGSSLRDLSSPFANVVIPSGTDGYAAIQAAIDAASAAARGWVAVVKVIGDDMTLSAPLVPKSNVALIGGVGRAKVRIRTENISFFVFPNEDVTQFSVEGFYLSSLDGVNAQTDGWAFDLSPGSIRVYSQIKIRNCVVYRPYGGIRFGANSRPLMFDVEDVEFLFGANYYVSFVDGCQTNLVNFSRCRFEQNLPASGSQIKSVGSASAILGVNFSSCVFEANYGQYAVDLGDNPSFGFYNCHFEANNQGANANGADIRWNGGSGSVVIQHCAFANPYSTATSWYNVRGGDSSVTCVSIGNRVTASASGYSGYVRVLYGSSFVSIADNFASCPVTLDPLNAVVSPIVLGSQDGRSRSQAWGPSTHRLQTTGNTATAIWTFDYHKSGMTTGVYNIHAIVCCTDSGGTVQGRWEINQAISTGATPAALGSDTGAAAQKSAGASACIVALAFSSSNNGQIKLNVTGLTATTINWTALIHLTLAAI